MNESDSKTIEILDICCKVTTDWGPRKVLYYLSISTKHRPSLVAFRNHNL